MLSGSAPSTPRYRAPLRWAAFPLAVFLAVLSASASEPMANPFSFKDFLVDSSNKGDALNCYPRPMRIYRVRWAGTPYFLVNAGTRLMFFPMDPSQEAVASSLTAGPASCEGFPGPPGDKSLDGYSNVAACDDCRYVPVTTDRRYLAVFDLGTGATPSFGEPQMYRGSIGATYSVAGTQFIVATGIVTTAEGKAKAEEKGKAEGKGEAEEKGKAEEKAEGKGEAEEKGKAEEKAEGEEGKSCKTGIYRPQGSGPSSTLTLVDCLPPSIHPSFGFQVDDTLVYVDKRDHQAHVVQILPDGSWGTEWASWPCWSNVGSMLNVDQADYPRTSAWILSINNRARTPSSSATVRRMTKSGSMVSVETYVTFSGEPHANEWRGGGIGYPYVFLSQYGSFSAHKVLYDISNPSSLKSLRETGEFADYWNYRKADFNIGAAGNPYYSVAESDGAFSFDGKLFVWARYYTMPCFELSSAASALTAKIHR